MKAISDALSKASNADLKKLVVKVWPKGVKPTYTLGMLDYFDKAQFKTQGEALGDFDPSPKLVNLIKKEVRARSRGVFLA